MVTYRSIEYTMKGRRKVIKRLLSVCLVACGWFALGSLLPLSAQTNAVSSPSVILLFDEATSGQAQVGTMAGEGSTNYGLGDKLGLAIPKKGLSYSADGKVLNQYVDGRYAVYYDWDMLDEQDLEQFEKYHKSGLADGKAIDLLYIHGASFELILQRAEQVIAH